MVYYCKNSCSTAMLWRAQTNTLNLSYCWGFIDSYSAVTAWSGWVGVMMSSLSLSSSWIKISAFIAWCSARSCLSICESTAHMFKCISHGLLTIKLYSTVFSSSLIDYYDSSAKVANPSSPKFMQLYSSSSAFSRYYKAFLYFLVFLNKHA